MSNLATPTEGVAPKPKKTLWETIITTTPVALTIVATVLAGLSSGEMGRAQYFRSLAAQWQAKVSDQWNFFQAKRLKAGGVDNTLELKTASVPFNASALSSEVDRLLQRLTDAQATVEKIAPRTGSDTGSNTATTKEAAGLRTSLVATIDRAKALQMELHTAMADPLVTDALSAFANGKLPAISEKEIASAEVRKAIGYVEQNSPEADSPTFLKQIKDEEITAAMRTAEENAAAFDAASKPMGKSITRLLVILSKLSAVTTSLDRTVEDHLVTAQLSPGLEQLSRLTHAAVRESSRISDDLSAARLRYDSARYNRESTINLTIARVYEVQIRKLSFTSDRHRIRSGYFFYGMLGAQAAVTLASLALAVREKSVFWSIATALGTGAIGFGGYVYLFK